MTGTYTISVLEVTKTTYDEIHALLKGPRPDLITSDGIINMEGLGLKAKECLAVYRGWVVESFNPYLVARRGMNAINVNRASGSCVLFDWSKGTADRVAEVNGLRDRTDEDTLRVALEWAVMKIKERKL